MGNPYLCDYAKLQQEAIVRAVMNDQQSYYNLEQQDYLRYLMQMREMAMKAQIQREQDDRNLWGEELWAIMRETDRLAGLL